MAGPGLLVSVGYMDPGNWATDIEAGSTYGYGLSWMVMLSSLAAILLQTSSVRLGLVVHKDLARACRERYRPGVNRFLWVMAELAIIACDVAEVLGGALALHLLLRVTLSWGIAITAFDTVIVLGLQGKGFRQVEAIVLGLVFLYLHSSVVQTRHVASDERSQADAVRLSTLDTVVSLALAFLVNAAILALAAAAFHGNRHGAVTDIQDAYHLPDPLVGGPGLKVAGWALFAVISAANLWLLTRIASG